eukprot:TRINITY_DN8366_c0_g1_i1.p1 TRINITY_DN8366_c0_g1~~TRINITY_DN8366_c0_g1_i1.p1  ORF type:complete len:406 (-),score=77.84 TRINITY_DN8366_c0_g1_i1:704-1921(-)
MFLVTGGTGFIGSHTVLELLQGGHSVLVIDNLSNSYLESLKRVSFMVFGTYSLSSPHVSARLKFHQIDLCDMPSLSQLFSTYKNQILGVIHFASLKSVRESYQNPDMYWNNNVVGTTNLLRCMEEHQIFNIIFSSSACVYGTPLKLPISELDFPTEGADLPEAPKKNPYGLTKIKIENILKKSCNKKSSQWRVVVLRYFNPISAHPSGALGEHPRTNVSNLMPVLSQVSRGYLPSFPIFGHDYLTPDGTAIRDFIHVLDVAKGHVAALVKFSKEPGYWTYNLGTGRGYSVLQIIHSYEKISGKKINILLDKRRVGDAPILIADPSKAEKELGWKAERNIEDMCRDFSYWEDKNPYGYLSESDQNSNTNNTNNLNLSTATKIDTQSSPSDFENNLKKELIIPRTIQ